MYENKRLGFLFVLPFVLGVLLFKLFPFVMSLALSFTQYDVMDPPVYVGLANYRELAFEDPLFTKSLGVTLAFAFLAVPLRVGFALFVAHVLNFRMRGIAFFRSAFYLPSILGGSIAVAVLWRFLFARNGLVNGVLGVFGIEPVPWLADEHYSLWTIVLLFTWQFGSAMVIFLAALQGVPQSLYEAAEIDGANRWQKIWYVTLPGIAPTIATLFILNMGMFLSAGLDQVFNMQNDVNRSTIDIIDTYVYRIGLQTGEYALGTAAGLFKGVIGFVLIIIAHTVSKRLTGRGVW